MSKIKTIFVVGPTASGKTSLGIELAKKLNGEVVSADSMQIYKDIHIASAAPDDEEMQGIPHHLLEFADTHYQYSVADYVLKARQCIKDISSRGKTPIVVGGTGLYISSLVDNINYTDEKTDLKLREQLENEFDSIGAQKMLEKLAVFDPESAEFLHENDRRRIIRAFEVYMQTGKTKTMQNIDSHNGEETVEPFIIGISYDDREKLYERINKRVDIMIENGLVEEAKKTYEKNLKSGGFQAIGHKELYNYFRGESTLEEAVEILKMQTRRYAKRQLTWFRKDTRINWIYADKTDNSIGKAITLAENFIKE